jgi:hypothetical protein
MSAQDHENIRMPHGELHPNSTSVVYITRVLPWCHCTWLYSTGVLPGL